jgi:pimeloyl-CoA synthetase
MFEALVISSRTNNTRGAIAIRIISGKSLNSTVEKTKLSPH